MLSPSPLKEPTGESCCQMAAALGEDFQFAKLKQEGTCQTLDTTWNTEIATANDHPHRAKYPFRAT